MPGRLPRLTEGRSTYPGARRLGPNKIGGAVVALLSRFWVWLTPVFVYETIRHDETRATKGIELLVALGVLLFLVRRPHRAISGLIIGLPFATIILAALLRLGVPASVIRPLRFWKEALVLGIALAAVRQLLNRSTHIRTRLDRADAAVLGYLGLGLLYLLLPGLFLGSGAGAKLSFYARELGWRSDILYLGLFVVVRHCGLNRDQINRLFRQFIAVATVVAAVGVFEFFATSTWMNFVLKTLKVANYDSRVLGIANPTVQEVYGSIGGHHFVRIGSVLLSYLDAGFYFALALAVAVELFTRGNSSRFLRVALPLIAAALVLNQGRAALIGGAVGVLLGLRTQIGRSIANVERLAFALLIGLVASVPIIITSGLAHRFVASQSSNTGHIAATKHGFHTMSIHPLGTGLATGAGAGQTAALKGLETTDTYLVTEDQYLQIGVQLGFIGLFLYAFSLLFIGRALTIPRPPPTDSSYSGPAFGARNGLIALLVAGLVLHPFATESVDWSLFAICGAGAAALDSLRQLRARELAILSRGRSAPDPRTRLNAS